MIIIIIICDHCLNSCFFVQGPDRKGGGGGGGSHWEEALVAIVETQCCWKLGDIVELQASL